MRLVIVVLAALLVVVGVVVVPAGRAEAGEAVAPSSCGVAELAPVLTGDDVRPRSAAALVPIVMLHGWLGTATHDADRTGAFSHLVDMVSSESATAPLDAPEPSLLGRLQQIDGAAVYTFDYRRLAARWVTDPGISDALASSELEAEVVRLRSAEAETARERAAIVLERARIDEERMAWMREREHEQAERTRERERLIAERAAAEANWATERTAMDADREGFADSVRDYEAELVRLNGIIESNKRRIVRKQERELRRQQRKQLPPSAPA